MRNLIIKPVLSVALALAGITPAFAEPFYAASQSLQDLRPQNDMAAKAYLKFSLGGKRLTSRERFRSGLKLQMRNVLQSQNLQDSRFVYPGGDINLLDLSMGAQGFSSMKLNGVPLQQASYTLNADEDGNNGGSGRGMRSGLVIAGAVIIAIGVAAAAAGGSSNDTNDPNHPNDNQ
ncbi:MAG: hypothetical protein COA85_11290 [Robiginitomaculum sp.]|nr:MAG: hypothetical protein COA85_11290 [Robiginitomaculum sp.]